MKNHETIITNYKNIGKTSKKTLYKSLLNLVLLRSRAPLAISKNQIFFSLSDHQLAENLIFVFGFYERTKREIVCRFVKVANLELFSYKNISQIASKVFATEAYSLIPWKTKP